MSLKITQNVSFEFYDFNISHQFLSFLIAQFDRKLQVFKLSKFDRFWHFEELLSTQNVSVARFVRIVEWDFFCDFRTTKIGVVARLPTSYFIEVLV